MSLMFLRVGNELINLDEIIRISQHPEGSERDIPDAPPCVWLFMKNQTMPVYLDGEKSEVLKYYFNEVIPALNPGIIEDAQNYYEDREGMAPLLQNAIAQRTAQVAAAKAAIQAQEPPKKPRLLIIPKNVPASWDEGGV